MENNFFNNDNPKRPKLIRPLTHSHDTAQREDLTLRSRPAQQDKAMLKMSPKDVEFYVRDLAHLQECLRTALKLELSTIPPYLCGLYSIKEGTNQEAAAIIRSVVVEEMLHMVLVANILNAITHPKTIQSGAKLFSVKDIIADYPTALPGGIVPKVPNQPNWKVQLLKFSPEAIDEFCVIEMPSDPNQEIFDNTFDSIGQFYQAIRYGLERINRETPGGIFHGDPARQVTPEHYYGSGGKIVRVHTYEDAEEAIEEIVGQGEGIDGTIGTDYALFGEDVEYAHYFKFQEINHGRMYSANDTNFKTPVKSVPTGRPFTVSWSSAYNMFPNPKMAYYQEDKELYDKAESFNRTYVTLLNNINDAVSGQPDLLIKGITVMYDLKYKAVELMNIPFKDGYCAGPTFEYVDL